ncbi:hypothetical protein LX87_01028 [Larkinella arboricola]|uniref:Uncharacterized protein n=1 Tax=Larkinella arboricola TaxID=643671 RepID=A0A327X7D4_LARAB|nr:hypothetical protein [Larkinella arboricola]RAK02907.1 hypothetical protein LX87_01028 [Larkinella arboricola]
MSYTRSNIKRQLLADFFTGKPENLRVYKGKQEQKQCSSYRWAVYSTTEAIKYLINLDGSQKLLTDKEFDQIPNTSKFTLIDYSVGAKRLTPDEP